jgi:hypothetical protein
MTERTSQAVESAQEVVCPDLSKWNSGHSQAAQLEGWNVFHSDGSAGGDWQIQRYDNDGDVPCGAHLDSDDAAWTLVLKGNGAHHKAALDFIRRNNPLECALIAVLKAKLNIETPTGGLHNLERPFGLMANA